MMGGSLANTGPEGDSEAPFLVDLGEFTGPLDLLLDLARAQKVDLKQISILALAEQYLAYLERVREEALPVAAEYLVMAAWLAYLKSQLLLPRAERQEEDPQALADRLAERLLHLEALRRAGAWLVERPRLGAERLPRGAPEALGRTRRAHWQAGLPELFTAWREVSSRRSG